jgi:carbamoyl-phosphate synthase large subunit
MTEMRMVKVLISSIGRRSQLIDCFRRTFKLLGVEGRVLGIDVDPKMAPAARLADDCFIVPRCTDAAFIGEVLSICREHRVQLVVPTIDTELPAYAAHRLMFAQHGVDVAISSLETVQIACDKACTHSFLTSHSFPAVRQATANEAFQHREQWPFPLIVKPRRGSASIGVKKVESEVELQASAQEKLDDLIVQECAQGFECTVNVFVDRNGRCTCAVPHRRFEVRGGEVSKATTVREPRVISIARSVAEALPGAFGPLNIQCFVSDKRVVVTEINARFGGGYPLAFEAGANFPLWLLASNLGSDLPLWFDEWKDNLTMLRFDAAVYF